MTNAAPPRPEDMKQRLPSPLALARSLEEDERNYLIDQCIHGMKPDATEYTVLLVVGCFLHRCLQLGLDPFAGTITCVVRHDKKNGRPQPAYQTTYLGYRQIAERTGMLVGLDVRFDRQFEADGKPPVWCEATLTRVDAAGREKTYTYRAYFLEWVKPTSFWADRPWDMLRIRALARLLREGFADRMGDLGMGSVEDQLDDVEAEAVVDTRVTQARTTPPREQRPARPLARGQAQALPALPAPEPNPLDQLAAQAERKHERATAPAPRGRPNFTRRSAE